METRRGLWLSGVHLRKKIPERILCLTIVIPNEPMIIDEFGRVEQTPTIETAHSLNDLIKVIESGIKQLESFRSDTSEVKKDLTLIKLLNDAQVSFAEVEKINNQTLREKVLAILVRLGARVDLISAMPHSHLKRHEAGWTITHVHPDQKTVDIARGVPDGTFNEQLNEKNERLERKDGVPLSDLSVSKAKDEFAD